MTSLGLALTMAAVRGWTRFYTHGLPPAVGARRRAEIESDLWESLHDPRGGPGVAPAAQVMLRLVAGAVQDLSWRFEQTHAEGLVRRALVVVATMVLVLTTLSVIPLWSGDTPHQHCVVRQPIELEWLNPSANCDCQPRAAELPRSRPRAKGSIARVVCRP